MTDRNRRCELTSWKWSHETILGLYRPWSQTGAGTLWTRHKHHAALVTTDSTPLPGEVAHLILSCVCWGIHCRQTCKYHVIYSSMSPHIRNLYTAYILCIEYNQLRLQMYELSVKNISVFGLKCPQQIVIIIHSNDSNYICQQYCIFSLLLYLFTMFIVPLSITHNVSKLLWGLLCLSFT